MRACVLTLATLLFLLPGALAQDAEKPGTLRLKGEPGVRITIDGKPAGVTGRKGLRVGGLTPGAHALVAHKSGFHAQKVTFSIRAGRSTRLSLGSLVPKHRLAVADVSNPRVTDIDRRHPQPESGGTLRVRVSALPPFMSRWFGRPPTQNISSEINRYLYAPMLLSDPDTSELLPFVAQYWRTQDVIDLLTEGMEESDVDPEKTKYARRYGVVLESVPGKHVILLEGASRVTAARHEVTADAKSAKIAGGPTFKIHDAPTPMGRYTLRFVDHTSAKRVTIPWKKVAKVSWALGMGKARKRQPGVRRSCRYSLHLRKGVTWHDGKPFTAADVAFTFARLNKGLRELRRGQPARHDPMNWLRDVTAPDTHTVVFDWSRPYFPSLALSGNMAVLPKHLYEQAGADARTWWSGFQRNPDLRTPTGYGPYRFDKRTGQTIELARNASFFARKLALPYWDARRPYFDRIHWVAVSTPKAALDALLGGQVDVMKGFEPKYWFDEAAQTDAFAAKFVRTKALQPVYTFIGWNQKKPYFKDRRVRQALAMLLPRKLIAQKVHRNLAFPVSGPFFYNSPAYDKGIAPRPSDHKKALALLKEAGYHDSDEDGWVDYPTGDGKTRKPLEIEYLIHDARDYHADIAQLVKETLQGARIKVRVRKVAWRSFSGHVFTKGFDAVRFAFRASFDPDVYPMWHSSQAEAGINYVSYANPEVDRLLEQAQVTFDSTKRWAMLRKVHRLLHDDEPYTFMFCFYTLAYYSNDLRGAKLYPTNPYGPDFTEWWRAPKKRTGWVADR